jgi:hypothetical protein
MQLVITMCLGCSLTDKVKGYDNQVGENYTTKNYGE